MELNNEIKGFALLCDGNGIITSVLRDDFGLANDKPIGKLFATLVEPSLRKMSLDFLLEVQQRKISFDYRFDIIVKEKSLGFYFIGLKLANELLIIGADNHKEAIDFANRLQQINNEQSNQIRQLLKKQFETNQNSVSDNDLLFNEISNLNNELVNLQRELTRKNIELERLNELKNRFLGMAAHDLRNPLGIIQNYTEFIIDEISDEFSEEHKDFLNTIHNSASSMLRIVEDLLDYSKIESGKVELNISEYDLASKCKKLVENYNTLSGKKAITIRFECLYEKLLIKADDNKIDQVLNNLLGNAIKFSYPESVIDVKIISDNEYVTVSVSDKGKGIKPEVQEKLFIPFQGTTTGTSGEKGTGLGLSIVKRIIDAHNGNIWVDSIVEKGTTFYFRLPIN